MPLVRIDLRQGTSPAYRKAIADGVHAAMVESLAIPPDDRFQVISERDADSLIYDPQYLGIQRSDKVVFIQITMSVWPQARSKTRAIQAHRRTALKVARIAPGRHLRKSYRGRVGKLVVWSRRSAVHQGLNSRSVHHPDALKSLNR